jgi:hypothetical protein
MPSQMSEQFPLRERHDKRLLKEIAAAVDSYISIRPIHALISDYCAFHGMALPSFDPI